MAGTSPKLAASMAMRGGRHYQGQRLYPKAGQPWLCPNCGAEQAGALEEGCQACGVGQPMMAWQEPQVGRTATRESNLGAPRERTDQRGSTPRRSTSVADQLRQRQPLGASADFAELEARIAALLDAKLSALAPASPAQDFSLEERFALVEGLRTLNTLIELGDVTPPARLLPQEALLQLAETLDHPSFYTDASPLDPQDLLPTDERTATHAADRPHRTPSAEPDDLLGTDDLGNLYADTPGEPGPTGEPEPDDAV